MIGFIQSKLAGYLVGGLMILALLAEIFRRGASWKENEIQSDFIERERDGRNEVLEEQTETDGLSSGDLIERMRRRGRDWAGV